MSPVLYFRVQGQVRCARNYRVSTIHVLASAHDFGAESQESQQGPHRYDILGQPKGYRTESILDSYISFCEFATTK